MLKSNVGKVAQALLSKSQGNQSSQGAPEATEKQEGWIKKHRRLLRRRSTDSDVCIVVTEAHDSKETLRKSTLALYGVHRSSSSSRVAKDVMDLCDEEALALGDQRSKSPEGHAQDMLLVDLTMCTPVWGHHGSSTSCSRPKTYDDELLRKSGPRLVGWECGSI